MNQGASDGAANKTKLVLVSRRSSTREKNTCAPRCNNGSCNSHNFALAVPDDDDLDFSLFSCVAEDNVCKVGRISLDAAAFHEGTAEDDVEVRLFAQVNRQGYRLPAYGNWPLADAGTCCQTRPVRYGAQAQPT